MFKASGESEAEVLSRFIPDVCVLCELEVVEGVRLGHMYAHILLRDIKCPHCTFCHDVQQCMETHLEQHRQQDAKTKASIRSAKQFVLSDMTIYPGMTITSPAVEDQPKTRLGEVKREKECGDKMNIRGDGGIINCSYCSMSDKIELNVLTHEVLVHRELVNTEITTRDALVLKDLKKRFVERHGKHLTCKLCGNQFGESDDRFLSHLTHHVKRFSVGCDCCTFSSDRNIIQHMRQHLKIGKYSGELQRAIQFVREGGCESLGTSSPTSLIVNKKHVGTGNDNREELPSSSSSLSTLNIVITEKRKDKQFPSSDLSKSAHIISKKRRKKRDLQADMDRAHSKKAKAHGILTLPQLKKESIHKKRKQMKSEKKNPSDKSGADEISCVFCDFSHPSTVYTLTHEVIHHRACVTSCLQGFDRSGRVDVDVSRYYPYKKGFTTCHLCGRVSKNSRLQHILNHINPGMHKCNICTYSSKISIGRHNRLHLKQEEKFIQTLIDARLAAGGIDDGDNEYDEDYVKDEDKVDCVNDSANIICRDNVADDVDEMELSSVAGAINLAKEINLPKAGINNENKTKYGAELTFTNTYHGPCGMSITSNTPPYTASSSNTPPETSVICSSRPQTASTSNTPPKMANTCNIPLHLSNNFNTTPQMTNIFNTPPQKKNPSYRSGAFEFSCVFCDFSHRSIVYTLTHEVIHHGARVTSCLQGGGRSGGIDMDVSRYYPTKNNRSACQLCGCVTRDRHSRLAHILNHINPGTYKCNICTFSSQSRQGGHNGLHLRQEEKFKHTLIDARLAAGGACDKGGGVANADHVKDADDTYDIDDVHGVDERADDIGDGVDEGVDELERSGTRNCGKKINLPIAGRTNEGETKYGAEVTLTKTFQAPCGSAITSNNPPQAGVTSNNSFQAANTSLSNSSIYDDMFMDDMYKCSFCKFMCNDKKLVILHVLSHKNDKK